MMFVYPASGTTIRAIFVSTDQEYANLVAAGLAMTSITFHLEQISPVDFQTGDLAARIRRLSVDGPALVILDFEGLRDGCDEVAARLLALRAERPIECIVTRARFDPQTRQKFLDLGGFLFDEHEACKSAAGPLDGKSKQSERRRAAWQPVIGVTRFQTPPHRAVVASRSRKNCN